MKKRIGINLLGVLPSIGGAYNYVKNFLDLISKYDNLNEYYLFLPNNHIELNVDQTNFVKIVCEVNTNNRYKRIIYENFKLPFLCRKNKIDFMIWPIDTIAFFTNTKNIVISHDFLPIISPKQFSFIKRTYLSFMLKNTTRKADFFFFISKTTESEFKSLNLRKKYKSIIFPNSINYHFKTVIEKSKIDDFKLRYNLTNPYWIYVAHNYPHKNHIKLILAFSGFKRKQKTNVKLILRGDNLEFNEKIKSLVNELELYDSIVFLPKLSFKDLPLLYNSADALVFPSLYEGGGIPLMEAQACGCPIMASNISAVLEFCKNSSYMFDPNSVDSIIETMSLFYLLDKSTKMKKVEFGIENTKELRPDFLVNRLLYAYEELLET
jgi:glycosyltransferase involved in cell wall biosynthesis